MELHAIQKKIYEIRGQKIMLDFDLAALYEVETKALNQAVNRNKDRFPKDFMFRITKKEMYNMRSQIVTSYSDDVENELHTEPLQIKVSQKQRRKDLLPYAFTEHGITMLASVLRSSTAIKMNIAIIRAFIALRKFAIQYKYILEQLKGLKEKIGSHDAQLNQIYEALENMLDKKVDEENTQEDWQNRKRIGFTK